MKFLKMLLTGSALFVATEAGPNDDEKCIGMGSMYCAGGSMHGGPMKAATSMICSGYGKGGSPTGNIFKDRVAGGVCKATGVDVHETTQCPGGANKWQTYTCEQADGVFNAMPNHSSHYKWQWKSRCCVNQGRRRTEEDGPFVRFGEKLAIEE